MDKADAQTTNRQAAEEDKPTGYPTMQCAEGKGEWGKGQHEAIWLLLASVRTEKTDAILFCK